MNRLRRRYKIFLLLVALTALSGCGLPQNHSASNGDSSPGSFASRMQRWGQVSQAEYKILRTIADKVDATGVISDKELDYLISIIQDKSTAHYQNPGLVRMQAGAAFCNIRTYAPGQKEKIMSVCLPLIHSDDSLDERLCLRVAEHQGDKRAIPYAVSLLSSTKSFVSKDAQDYLDSVHYKAGQ